MDEERCLLLETQHQSSSLIAKEALVLSMAEEALGELGAAAAAASMCWTHANRALNRRKIGSQPPDLLFVHVVLPPVLKYD